MTEPTVSKREPIKDFLRWLYRRADGKQRLPANMWLWWSGLGLLVVALLVENPTISDLLTSLSWSDAHSWVFNQKTLASFSKELGFAFLIAFFISAGIERQSREREERAAEAARERIARDVFHGVFGLQHDRGYVNMVIEHVLQPKMVRERYDVEFTIAPLTDEEAADLEVDKTRFVKMHAISAYTFLNISNALAEHKINYIVPVREGKKLRDFARVTSAMIDREELTPAEIKAAEVPGDDPTKKYCFPKDVLGGGRIEVLISSTIIKEMSDNEVWRNMHPTIEGATFKVRMLVPDMTLGVRNITAAPIRKQYSDLPGGDSAWTIEGPILPNESVVVWWRTEADSGIKAVVAPVTKKATGGGKRE